MMQEFDHLASKIFTPITNGGKVPKLGMYLASDGSISFSIGGTVVFSIPPDGDIVIPNIGGLVVQMQPYYAVAPQPPQVVTAGVTTLMAASQFEVIVKKTPAASHTVTLPPNPVAGQIARVCDGNGALTLGGITLTVQSGSSAKINGQATHVMDYAWAVGRYRFDGTDWGIV